MSSNENILVIGSGVAGMEACIMLSKAGKKVYLVEKLPIIGGKTIKNEETFPNLDCSTCLVAPIQQAILQDKNIEVFTYSKVEKVSGQRGNFSVTIRKKARFVSLELCLGCGMCYEPCPVSLPNEWEENLMEKKAVYVPCSGSLPNVPVIDAEKCLHLNGTDRSCNICVDSCMFAAIDLDDKDQIIEIIASEIIVAAGFDLYDVSQIDRFGYGKYQGVYTSMEFERLFASNGPTEGKIITRNGKIPESVAIIQCAGREESGYCSAICCMSSSKHAHLIKDKLHSVKIYNLYSDSCLTDKNYQKFHQSVRSNDSEYIFQSDMKSVKVTEEEGKLKISYLYGKNEDSVIVDMVILANSLKPSNGIGELTEILGIDVDKFGFISVEPYEIGSVETTKAGIFVAGCAEGPKDIQSSILQAEAAVAGVLAIAKV
ncbi:MAG: FAD-dependent oxidoreductase [Candidatus Delongbacteria bacterium]|nr:FAD-dependent oxidoreductase [Candidatus Delongbacteria bacterium]MCG2761298.1 FAD-dependent oxidoreductase [Candidatus Delongbacteria bacterium]